MSSFIKLIQNHPISTELLMFPFLFLSLSPPPSILRSLSLSPFLYFPFKSFSLSQFFSFFLLQQGHLHFRQLLQPYSNLISMCFCMCCACLHMYVRLSLSFSNPPPPFLISSSPPVRVCLACFALDRKFWFKFLVSFFSLWFCFVSFLENCKILLFVCFRCFDACI